MRVRKPLIPLLLIMVLLTACPPKQGAVVGLGNDPVKELPDAVINSVAQSYCRAQRSLLLMLEEASPESKKGLALLREELKTYTANAPYSKKDQVRIYEAVSRIDPGLNALLGDKTDEIRSKFEEDKNFRTIYNEFCRMISGQE
jgi:hypothetical protein